MRRADSNFSAIQWADTGTTCSDNYRVLRVFVRSDDFGWDTVASDRRYRFDDTFAEQPLPDIIDTRYAYLPFRHNTAQ